MTRPTSHPLRTWLREQDKTQSWLAEELGVAPSTITGVLMGYFRLGRLHRNRVAEITKGAVTGVDLDAWEPDSADAVLESVN